ncbi:MAG: hypothetical protein J6X86_07810 [Bacteroidales bacterium]|nr:hypothetical protein [Bacteroidales bacterium]
MLTIRHIRHWYEPKVPHMVFLDGLYAGTLQNDNLQIDAPKGSYALRVQFGGRVPIGKKGKSIDLSLSSTKQVDITQTDDVLCEFHDRERLWNLLFDIDLIAWIVSMFVDMPPVYKIISDTFFALWIIRLIIIRKRYYRITIK